MAVSNGRHLARTPTREVPLSLAGRAWRYSVVKEFRGTDPLFGG